MRLSFRFLILLAVLYAAFPAARSAQAQQRKDDIVTLKDGRVIRGTIIEMFPNDSTFLMRLPDGTFARHNKADIAEMHQGKALRAAGAPTAKVPAVSWLLSFAFPGGGQMYNGQVVKGFAFAAVGAVSIAMYLAYDANACEFYDKCADELSAAGAALYVTAWVVSQIEAPLTAMKINRDINRHVALRVQPEPHALGISLVSLDF